jgi:hypothetical protein
MKIRSISARHIGPFLEPFSIPIDPRVTIITGANDAGKSSVLRAHELVFGNEQISEDEVNKDHLDNVMGNWVRNKNILVEADISLTRKEDVPGGIENSPNDSASILRRLGRDISAVEHHTTLHRNRHHTAAPIFPQVIRPRLKDALRDELNLKELLPLEKALLDAAFQRDFKVSDLENVKAATLSQRFQNCFGCSQYTSRTGAARPWDAAFRSSLNQS